MKKYLVKFRVYPDGIQSDEPSKFMLGSFEVLATSRYNAEWKVVKLFRTEVLHDGDGVEIIDVQEVSNEG